MRLNNCEITYDYIDKNNVYRVETETTINYFPTFVCAAQYAMLPSEMKVLFNVWRPYLT